MTGLKGACRGIFRGEFFRCGLSANTRGPFRRNVCKMKSILKFTRIRIFAELLFLSPTTTYENGAPHLHNSRSILPASRSISRSIGLWGQDLRVPLPNAKDSKGLVSHIL